ncbi:MAG: hypothetical protein U0Q22_06200 [Acidimicrobiales bacterium]
MSDDTRSTTENGEVAAHDAEASHTADRQPTPDEERRAEELADGVPDSVGEHYEEMIDIGANVKGEGEISP